MASKKKKTNNKNNTQKKVEVNYYKVLKVEDNATLKEMEKAYNKLLKNYKKEGLSENSKKMKELHQAYNALIKPLKETKVEKEEETLEQEEIVVEKKEEVLEEVEVEKAIVLDNSDKTKTILNIIIILVLIGGLFAISEFGRDSKNDKKPSTPASSNPLTEEEIPESEMKQLTNVTYAEFKEIMKSSEATVVFVGRPTCGWCVYQLPVLKNVMYIYNLEVKYLNTDEMTTENNQDFINLHEDFVGNGYGTPMLLIVQNDKIAYKLEGARDKAGIVQFLTSNGILGE